MLFQRVNPQVNQWQGKLGRKIAPYIETLKPHIELEGVFSYIIVTILMNSDNQLQLLGT